MALLAHHFLQAFEKVAENSAGDSILRQGGSRGIERGSTDGVLGALRAQPLPANQIADDFDWYATVRARHATLGVRAGNAHFRMPDLQACRAVVPGSELGFLEHELAIIGVLRGQQHGAPGRTNASSAIHLFP
jgi:hypothetical protein